MHPLYQQYATTVLGRLKTIALSELSGSLDRLPSQRQFFARVFKEWKANSAAGRLYYKLLDCYRIEPTEFPARVSSKAINELLTALNRSEYFERIFAEGRVHGLPGTPQQGCLVLGHERPDGGPSYYAAIYENDPDRCVYCSLIPATSTAEGRISVLATTGWHDISPEEVSACVPARLMVTALSNHLRTVDQQRIPVSQLRSNPSDQPPEDSEFIRRIQEVAEKRMSVTSAFTSLDKIVPHDIEFCLSFGINRVNALAARIRCGFRPAMAVYWNGSGFEMSDDYPIYMAYRRADCETAAISILGNFPLDAAREVSTGGVELLPPVAVASVSVHPGPVNAAFKSWRLEEGLRGKPIIPNHLIAVWMTFADLLDDASADEKTIHQFILRCPEVLTVYGTKFESEVRLGDKYRVDIVVHASGVKEHITLVELEHHRHALFTQDGQTRAEITHALKQVQDWLRWLRENPADPCVAAQEGLPPAGLVVAGRSRNLPEENRSRLAHINVGSAVQVITYDELLDRLGDVILSRLDS